MKIPGQAWLGTQEIYFPSSFRGKGSSSRLRRFLYVHWMIDVLAEAREWEKEEALLQPAFTNIVRISPEVEAIGFLLARNLVGISFASSK